MCNDLTTLTTDKRAHMDFMIIDKVAIELLNRILSGFCGLIMDITIPNNKIKTNK